MTNIGYRSGCELTKDTTSWAISGVSFVRNLEKNDCHIKSFTVFHGSNCKFIDYSKKWASGSGEHRTGQNHPHFRSRKRFVKHSFCDLMLPTFHMRHLAHWGRDKMDAISQTKFSNAFSWMKMFEYRLKYHWNLCLRVQLTIFQHWFR